MFVMPDSANLVVFVAAALVLLLTPGPAVLYIVARSIDQGRRAGLVSMLGVHAGTLVHIAAAAAGVSALLAASATVGTIPFLFASEGTGGVETGITGLSCASGCTVAMPARLEKTY